MRERAAALELGEREGLGEFRCVASRAFGHDWLFFTPIGLLMFAGGCWALPHDHHGWRWVPLAACAVGGLVFAALPLLHRFDRRPGSDVPRLYCFVDGVVIAAVRTLTVYRWTELTVHRRRWTSGSGETYDSGTSITLRASSAVGGRAVAYFAGNEPGRAHALDVLALHRSAVERSGVADS